MPKKKWVDLVGYPLYKCRLCGASFNDYRCEVFKITDALQGWTDDKHALSRALYSEHACQDGNAGVADLSGLTGVRHAVIDRWGRYVDTESMQLMPPCLGELRTSWMKLMGRPPKVRITYR